MSIMVKCPYCFSDVDSRASICPQCKKRIKTSLLTWGCAAFVVLLVALCALAIILGFFRTQPPPSSEEGVSKSGLVYSKAPQHSLSDTSQVKPLIDVYKYLKVRPDQLKKMLYKDYGSKATYIYDDVQQCHAWKIVLREASIEIVPYMGKIVQLQVDFAQPVKDRAVALAYIGLHPTTQSPTIDAIASPQWLKTFPDIDKVFALYEPVGGPGVSCIVVIQDDALATKWGNEP